MCFLFFTFLLSFCVPRIQFFSILTRRALGGAHVPPTKVFRRLTGSVSKTLLKALLAAAANRPTYTSDFPDVKFRVAALK